MATQKKRTKRPAKKPAKEALTVEILESPTPVPSIYTNQVEIRRAPFDFTLTLREIVGIAGDKLQVKELIRVYMSPQHAKSMAALLQQEVAAYEARHGELPAVNSMSNVVL